MTSVSPSAGPTAGGTSVTIGGSGFTGATAVKFGSTAATTYTVVSDTQLTATSPARSAGTVHVTVTNSFGTSSTSSADQFSYDARPTVTSVSPTSGISPGGASVTVDGTGFVTGSTTVAFGSAAGTGVTVSSSTVLTVTSPEHAFGLVNVTVTTPGGTSATGSADHFTYDQYAYVANYSSGTISVVDGSTETVVSTITLPSTSAAAHPDSLALSRDGTTLYVADVGNNDVLVYATATGSEESAYTITSGIADPVKLSAATDGSFLAVANARSDEVTLYALTSDLPSTTPAYTVSSPAISNPGALAFVPGTDIALLASTGGNAVVVVNSDGTTGQPSAVSADDPFEEPDAIGYSTDASTAYVADETGQVEEVSTSSDTLSGAISGTQSGSYATSVPSAIWCTSSTKCLVANAGDNMIGWFSTSTGAMTGEDMSSTDIDGPVALASLPGQSVVYVVNDANGTIGIWSTASSTMTGAITVGTNPCAIAVMKD